MKDSDMLLLGAAAVGAFFLFKKKEEDTNILGDTVNNIVTAADTAVTNATNAVNDAYLELLNPGTDWQNGVLVSGGSGGIVTSALQATIAQLASMGIDTSALEALYFGINGAPGQPFTSTLTAVSPTIVAGPAPDASILPIDNTPSTLVNGVYMGGATGNLTGDIPIGTPVIPYSGQISTPPGTAFVSWNGSYVYNAPIG